MADPFAPAPANPAAAAHPPAHKNDAGEIPRWPPSPDCDAAPSSPPAPPIALTIACGSNAPPTPARDIDQPGSQNPSAKWKPFVGWALPTFGYHRLPHRLTHRIPPKHPGQS